MKYFLLLIVFIISSCSWFSKPKEEFPNPPRIIYRPAPTPKQAKRELGSLWSEESSWNDIYSETLKRSPGDVLTLKLADGFKNRLLSFVSPYRDKTTVPAKDTANKQDPALAAPSQSAKDLKEVNVTILEIISKGLYRISANQTMRLNDSDPFVAFEGVIRESEIALDDTISSNALLDLKAEIIRPEDPTPTKQILPQGTPGSTVVAAGDKK